MHGLKSLLGIKEVITGRGKVWWCFPNLGEYDEQRVVGEGSGSTVAHAAALIN